MARWRGLPQAAGCPRHAAKHTHFFCLPLFARPPRSGGWRHGCRGRLRSGAPERQGGEGT
eukprot:5090866-Pyramimonas_sp.AAC.1